MEVLSNKEIYVLLKILNDKKVKNGDSSTIEVDKNFALKELEHIQNEIALSENKIPEEVLTIENTYKNMFGQSFHSGYSILIHDMKTVKDYAVNYVETYITGELSSKTSDTKFTKLLSNFYNSSKSESNIKNFKTNDLKYMPVILFAYINDLVDIKSISNKKYDYRLDYQNDDNIMFDNLFVKVKANGVTQEIVIDLGMDASKLSEAALTIGVGARMEEVDANTLIEMIKRIKSEKLSNDSGNYDENALIDKLRKDFHLSETCIKILCACKYLQQNDIEEVTNKKISEYLTKNNFPITDGDIKQSASAIKQKCYITGRGISSLVQALELKGYTIPSFKPLAKV